MSLASASIRSWVTSVALLRVDWPLDGGMQGNPTGFTELLARARAGEGPARDALYRSVAEELHGLAEREMRRQQAGHTLQATALVHEAWIRLAGQNAATLEGREHFLAVAARAMRSVMIDHARRKLAEKRGPAAARVTLSAELAGPEASPEVLVALHEGLEELRALDPELERIAEMRIFGGLSCADVASVTGTPLRTVERAWQTGRAWLQRALGGDAHGA